MDLNRFREIVDAYGADARRWPEGERAAALAFAERSDAHAILAEADALDALLDAGPTPAASPELRERILASSLRRPRFAPGPVFAWRGGRVLSGAALAAACACGVVFGWTATAAGLADFRAEVVLEAETASAAEEAEEVT